MRNELQIKECRHPTCGDVCRRPIKEKKFYPLPKPIIRTARKEITEDGLSDMIADADALFSKYIRTKNIDKNGIATCYTCDTKKRWQEMDCGHYVSRAHMYLRYDTRNSRVQCGDCNRIKNGNLAEYTRRLELEHKGITQILLEESRIVYKHSREELRSIISELTSKLKLLNLR